MTIDGRFMQPPEPLERTLAALEDLAVGDELTLLVNHRPEPLLFLLEDAGFVWQEAVLKGGTYELRIRHAPPGPRASTP